MQIIRRYYDSCEDQNRISGISLILQWLSFRGYKVVYYGRVESNNKFYPHLEFVVQKEGDYNPKDEEDLRNFEFDLYGLAEEVERIKELRSEREEKLELLCKIKETP